MRQPAAGGAAIKGQTTRTTIPPASQADRMPDQSLDLS
jgi:hypothetical protein